MRGPDPQDTLPLDAGSRGGGFGAFDDRVRALVEAGDLAGATTLALQTLGADVLRFLGALHHSDSDAADAFALFAEGLWRGIGRFDWNAPLRAWVFAIARRSSLRLRRDAGRRAARELVLADLGALAGVVEQVRTETEPFLKTDSRNRFAQLRDALPPDDRMLLVLRVDRGLSWNECAVAFASDDGALDEDTLRRDSARLRKRFQLVKARLLEAGRRDGLIPATGDPG